MCFESYLGSKYKLMFLAPHSLVFAIGVAENPRLCLEHKIHEGLYLREIMNFQTQRFGFESLLTGRKCEDDFCPRGRVFLYLFIVYLKLTLKFSART